MGHLDLGCNSHHNWAGLSGTAGNSLWVHDNDFHDNSVGIALDSLFPDHPGMPQGYSRFTGNRIFSNNEGIGNCRQANTSSSGTITSDPSVLPDCSAPPVFTPPDPVKVQGLLACLAWGPNNLDPPGCDWEQPAPPT